MIVHDVDRYNKKINVLYYTTKQFIQQIIIMNQFKYNQ